MIADYPYFKEKVKGSCYQAVEGGHLQEEPSEYWMENNDRRGDVYSNIGPAQRYIAAIEAACEMIPEEYVEYVMKHITEGIRYKDIEDVSEKTLKVWTQRFIWYVAYQLGEI